MKEQVKEEVLDAKRLFYFSQVFKYGSVNAVADRLDMAQAGIGRQIQLLERELGMLLFERGTNGRGMVAGGRGRGMVPTEAAHLVNDYYLKNRDDQEKLKVALEEMRQMKRGKISIAMFPVYVDTFIEKILNDFCSRYPDLTIQIEDINSSPEMVSRVIEDDVHIGMCHNALVDQENLRCCARVPAPIYLLVNKQHPFADKQRVSFAEAARYPLVLPPIPFSERQMIRQVEQSEKIQINPLLVSNSASTRKKFSATNQFGATFMAASAARKEIDAGQLHKIEVDHPALTCSELCLIVRRRRQLSPAVNQLLKVMTRKFQIFSDESKNTLSA